MACKMAYGLQIWRATENLPMKILDPPKFFYMNSDSAENMKKLFARIKHVKTYFYFQNETSRDYEIFERIFLEMPERKRRAVTATKDPELMEKLKNYVDYK